jgi:hypothetical protein
MSQISETTQKLISRYQKWQESLEPKQGIATIHVDEVASRVAAFYEKIRGIIDWKEEHLLKRRAIERILKRRLFSKLLSEGTISENSIAEPMVLELIRGGHFPNDKIEETKIEQVQKAVDKYIFIVNNTNYDQKKSKIQLYSWLSAIAACEIEEILSPSIRERALISYMFEIMSQRIETNEKIKISEEEKNTQTYIAVQKALFNLDASIITYHILKYRYPDWKNLSPDQLNDIAQNIHLMKTNLEKEFNHPLSDKFYNICEKYDTPFLLLGDVLSKNPVQAKEKISNPELLETSITTNYNQRVKTLKKRLARAAFYATLSIFLTNIVSLLLIEMPFNKWVTGYFFNYWAITIDILGPTFLMFLLVITIKPPKKENLARVLIEVMKIVYDKGKKDVYPIKKARKRNIIFDTIINFIYLLGFLAILYIIIWVLYQVNFPPLSYLIFIIFLSLIAFAGAKIRQRAKELQVIEEKETLFHLLIDPFAVPVIQLGKWLTAKWTRYNVIAVFFSALIDMPFTIFIEFIEQWRYFLKEKKEKIH